MLRTRGQASADLKAKNSLQCQRVLSQYYGLVVVLIMIVARGIQANEFSYYQGDPSFETTPTNFCVKTCDWPQICGSAGICVCQLRNYYGKSCNLQIYSMKSDIGTDLQLQTDYSQMEFLFMYPIVKQTGQQVEVLMQTYNRTSGPAFVKVSATYIENPYEMYSIDVQDSYMNVQNVQNKEVRAFEFVIDLDNEALKNGYMVFKVSFDDFVLGFYYRSTYSDTDFNEKKIYNSKETQTVLLIVSTVCLVVLLFFFICYHNSVIKSQPAGYNYQGRMFYGRQDSELEQQIILNHLFGARFFDSQQGISQRNRENQDFRKNYDLLMPVFDIDQFSDSYQKQEKKRINLISECCSICLENFEDSKEIRITICLHLFHKMCLDQWMESHRTCPQCRQQHGVVEWNNFSKSIKQKLQLPPEQILRLDDVQNFLFQQIKDKQKFKEGIMDSNIADSSARISVDEAPSKKFKSNQDERNSNNASRLLLPVIQRQKTKDSNKYYSNRNETSQDNLLPSLNQQNQNQSKNNQNNESQKYRTDAAQALRRERQDQTLNDDDFEISISFDFPTSNNQLRQQPQILELSVLQQGRPSNQNNFNDVSELQSIVFATQSNHANQPQDQ